MIDALLWLNRQFVWLAAGFLPLLAVIIPAYMAERHSQRRSESRRKWLDYMEQQHKVDEREIAKLDATWRKADRRRVIFFWAGLQIFVFWLLANGHAILRTANKMLSYSD